MPGVAKLGQRERASRAPFREALGPWTAVGSRREPGAGARWALGWGEEQALQVAEVVATQQVDAPSALSLCCTRSRGVSPVYSSRFVRPGTGRVGWGRASPSVREALGQSRAPQGKK